MVPGKGALFLKLQTLNKELLSLNCVVCIYLLGEQSIGGTVAPMNREIYLITGSSGLLGRALCHHFGSKNHIVIGFDKQGPPFPPPNSECLFCDLTSDESVQKTFHLVRIRYGTDIKAVIHLSAYYDFSGKKNHLYKDLTIDGTSRLLRELKNFRVGQFIFSSSMLVYRPNLPGQVITEDSPVEPFWEYPLSKVKTEDLIKEQHDIIPAVVLRIAGVYDDLCQCIPIAHQIQRIYEKRLEGHFYPGDIGVRQSYIHLDDVVSAYDAVVNHASQLPGYSVFNIGEENAMSYDEIQQTVAQLIYGKTWFTMKIPKLWAKAGAWIEDRFAGKEKPFIQPWMVDRSDDNFELSIRRARAFLRWKPAYSLRTSLPKIIEGLEVDPVKWYKLNKLKEPPCLRNHPKNKTTLRSSHARL